MDIYMVDRSILDYNEFKYKVNSTKDVADIETRR